MTSRSAIHSPAEAWYRGKLPEQRIFARRKLHQVAKLLGEEAARVDADARRWRPWPSRRRRLAAATPRVYELEDARRTILDAERQLRPDCTCMSTTSKNLTCPIHGDRQFREVDQ
jgi:hypothetical protein